MREGSQNSSAGTLSARYRNPLERPKMRERLKNNNGNVFGRLGHRRQSAFERLSDTYSPSTTKSGPDRANFKDHSHSRGRPHRRDSSSRDRPRSRDRSRDVEESYGNTCSSYGTGADMDITLVTGTAPVPTDEEDLAVPWTCEERPRGSRENFPSRSTSGTRAMPTWCHMFNSTLIGAARVWFDEIPPKSIDGYKDLKVAFLAYFMQQIKYVKDPVEIHNIKQWDRETIEDFMKRFKVETGCMKGDPECMQISGFIHGANNPELTKRLNEHVPKTMEEMMIATTAFIRGEAAAASKKKGHTSWKPQDQPKRHVSAWKSDFRSQPREGQGSSSEITFPPLTTSSGTEGLLVIEAEIGGHMIHRMSDVPDVIRLKNVWLPDIPSVRIDKAFDNKLVSNEQRQWTSYDLDNKESSPKTENGAKKNIDEDNPDFLVEKSGEAPPDTSVVETPQEPWTLFTDGSLCVDGSGAGLIMTSPKGTEFTYALRFQFTASNNEA
ncbi:reverse transcriptase domain-containing protein [Tanacetum coccineum]